MAYPKSHNPFADDDDEEDFKPKSSRGFDDDDCDGLSDAERKQRYLQQEVMRTAQSSVESTQRSLGLIYESEKIGVDTAEVCKTSQMANKELSLCHREKEILKVPFLTSIYSFSLYL